MFSEDYSDTVSPYIVLEMFKKIEKEKEEALKQVEFQLHIQKINNHFVCVKTVEGVEPLTPAPVISSKDLKDKKMLVSAKIIERMLNLNT